MIIAQSEWTPASTETCWLLGTAVRAEQPNSGFHSCPGCLGCHGCAPHQHHQGQHADHTQRALPTNSSSGAFPFLGSFRESRLLKAQCTLQSVCSFPSAAQPKLLKLFSLLLNGNGSPHLNFYTPFPQVAPLTVTSVPKDLLYPHSPLVPPSSSTGVYVCV